MFTQLMLFGAIATGSVLATPLRRDGFTCPAFDLTSVLLRTVSTDSLNSNIAHCIYGPNDEQANDCLYNLQPNDGALSGGPPASCPIAIFDASAPNGCSAVNTVNAPVLLGLSTGGSPDDAPPDDASQRSTLCIYATRAAGVNVTCTYNSVAGTLLEGFEDNCPKALPGTSNTSVASST
ncbi:hypothetical protein DFH06DRAFT_1434365 [Mycena polygramma]|nr:hypothetical protein DFH06DRAFT_1434365 [Mycena polygramma]